MSPDRRQLAREFLADQNTDDRGELLYRARRYAAAKTSAMTQEVSSKVVTAFTAEVDALIRTRPPRRQASRPVTHYADFDDQFLHIE